MTHSAFIRYVLAITATTCTSAFAASQELVWPQPHCAILTWPDKHETRLGTYAELERFASACEKPTGNCAIDGNPFPSKRPDGSSDSSALGEAFGNCTLGPLPVERSTLNNQNGKDQMLREDPVPELTRSFLQDCVASGNRRGADPMWTKRACNCSWDMISSNMTKSEYIEFAAAVRNDQNATALPQFRRVQPKLELCK